MNRAGPYTIEIAGVTDAGRQRQRNEDAIGWDEHAAVAVLADGMGGHNAGEVAAELAVRSILEALVGRRPLIDPQGCGRAVRTAIEQANGLIHERSGTPGHAGMGTTVAVLCLEGEGVTLAHVGDSRIYRLRDGVLTPLTSDHSVVQELIDGGLLSQEEAGASVSRNYITRALGIEPTVEVELGSSVAAPGDLFLLCSDGLTDHVEAAGLRDLLSVDEALSARAAALVEAANRAGGSDNISVILVRLR